ncbi:MAG: tetratricopeptide repeat protein [Blastocatellia bacterium]
MKKSKGKRKSTPKSQPAARIEEQKPVTQEPEELAVEAKPAAPQRKVESQSFSIKPGKSERNAVILILAITLIVFLNSLSGEFVYDDSYQILKNPTVQSAENIPAMFTQGVWQFMTSDTSKAVGLYYRPMFNSLLIVNYQLFGFSPFGWHLVSLLLHLAATFLVYRLIRAWDQPREVAALAALLFGIHPIHVESVAWVSGVPDPLATVFVLLALIFHERHVREGGASYKWQLASLAAALLALFTKEVAIAMAGAVVLREWLREKDGETFSARLNRSLSLAAPFIIAAMLYLAARIAVLGFISKPEPKAVAITAEQVLLTVPSVLFAYVRMLFAPYPLSVIYDHGYVNEPSQPPFWLPLLLFIAVIAISLWLVRKSKIGLLALAWTAMFVLPVLNLKAFNPEESIIHDRYLYLPSVGFCLLAAMGIFWLYNRAAASTKKLVFAAASLIVIVFSGLTFAQNLTWQNDLTMATHALNFAPGRPFLLNYLAAYYSNHSNTPEAEKYYKQAIAAKPDYYDAMSNLGDIYYKQNNFVESEKYYAQAVAAGGRYTQTLYNLADSRAKQNRFAEAEQPLLQAIAEQANYTDAHYYLGWVYQQQNKLQQSEAAYRNALNYKPDYPEPRINLATVMNGQGRLKEAEEQLEQVRKTQPGNPVMMYTLGEVYRKTNRTQEAIAILTQLTNAQPTHQQGFLSLGQCLEQAGNTSEAKLKYQRAAEIAPQTNDANTARDRLAKLP